MSPKVIDALVRLVANGRKFGVAEAVVIEHLIEMGVPQVHAAELLTEITQGLDEGVRSAAGGSAGPGSDRPASPLYAAAVAEGRRSATAGTQPQAHRVVLAIAALVVLGLLIYWFSR